MEFTIEDMRKGKWGKLRAFFDIKFTGFSSHFDMTVKGFKLVEGVNGMFVGMPSQKNSDDDYFDTVYADEDTKNKIRDAAKKVYEEDGGSVPEKNMEELIEEKKDDLPF